MSVDFKNKISLHVVLHARSPLRLANLYGFIIDRTKLWIVFPIVCSSKTFLVLNIQKKTIYETRFCNNQNRGKQNDVYTNDKSNDTVLGSLNI